MVKEDSIILLQALGNISLPDDFLKRFHTHIYCHGGNLTFRFNGRVHSCKTGDFVFWFADSILSDISVSKKFKATILLVEKDFLFANIPDQSWSIDVMLRSKENPILHLNDKRDKQKVILNFQLLHGKFSATEHRFYAEVLKLQMQLFILEMWHTFANEYEHRKRTLESGSLYDRFMHLVQEHCMKEREVQFYANKLNITAKYLNFVSKQNTGITASEWIQRYARERITVLLQNKNLNISEVADEMNFSSRSFFTRYVRKVLGVSPREFRQRMVE